MRKLLFLVICYGIFMIACNNTDYSNYETDFDEEDNETEIDGKYVMDLDEIESDIPKDIFIYWGKRELYENKDFLKALSFFDKALSYYKVNKEDSFIYNEIGKTQIKLNNINEAIESFTKAIELENKAEYYKERAEAYKLIGNNELASADIIEAKKLENQ